MEQLEASVTDITYRNEKTGFTVLQIHTQDGQNTVAVGTMPELAVGEQIRLTADWSEHPQYGKQLKVFLCETLKPTSERGIERYLASGLIKGVGLSTAALIVARFGDASLDVIGYAPEKLLEIKGIGRKKAEMIHDSLIEQEQSREALVLLQSYNISINLSLKIYKRYGNETRRVLRETPYRLIEDIEGIGFKTADRIAAALGISPLSPHRLRAGLIYALSDAVTGNGHTFLPKEQLISHAAQILNVEEAVLDNELASLLIDGKLTAVQKPDFTAIYLPSYRKAEQDTAKYLYQLRFSSPKPAEWDCNDRICDWESVSGLRLNQDQKDAVITAISEPVCVITGGPGTGKTTILQCIIGLLEQETVLLAAPTGRAAKRMSEATGCKALTLHRLLEYNGEEEAFSRNETNPLQADTIIIDEMSMVDLFLMRALLRAVPVSTRLILVGDADQLPSVGAGNVLRDIIKSNTVTVAWLREIYRQDETSMIVINAHRINQGKMPIMNSPNSDFFLVRCDRINEFPSLLVNLITQRLPRYLGIDPLYDIQVLTPMKKGATGVINLNTLLQAAFNPAEHNTEHLEWKDTVFRSGDKVMQTRNDYQMEWKRHLDSYSTEEGTGVFNGDMGYIMDVDEEEKTLTVRFDDDREALYSYQQLEDLELAYCISVHKSQGSEFPAVVLPVMGGPSMLLTRNLFYTAVTRAKRLLVLVGRSEEISFMVNHNKITQRYSGLCDCLEQISL